MNEETLAAVTEVFLAAVHRRDQMLLRQQEQVEQMSDHVERLTEQVQALQERMLGADLQADHGVLDD